MLLKAENPEGTSSVRLISSLDGSRGNLEGGGSSYSPLTTATRLTCRSTDFRLYRSTDFRSTRQLTVDSYFYDRSSSQPGSP